MASPLVNGMKSAQLEDPEGGSGAIVESLYRRLREAIVQCELPPDAIISQVRLAERFGVSRTPLREVLRLLEREGFVESEHNRRVRITGFSVPDLEEVFATRIAIEPLAARVGIASMTETDYSELSERLEEMRRSAARDDHPAWSRSHRDFHERLTASAGKRMSDILVQLADHSDRYRRIYAATGPLAWATGLRQHEQILDTVAERDPDRLSGALARHIAQSGLTLIAAADPGYDAVLIREALRVVVGDRGSLRDSAGRNSVGAPAGGRQQAR